MTSPAMPLIDTPTRALIRRGLGAMWGRTAIFAAFFVFYGVANVLGYDRAFPTRAERLAFARAFGGNPALKLFFGAPRDLTTTGGYVDWRVGGLLSIAAGFFGLWLTTSLLRGEEESGRQELVLAGAIGRGGAYLARLAAIALLLAALWLALAAAVAGAGLAAGGAARLAAGTIAVAIVYAGVGALTSQLAATQRGAMELGGLVLGLDLATRVIADTTGHDNLRWLTPLGWIEETRAFIDPRPALLLPPIAFGAALLALAGWLARGRDVGAGLLAARGTSRQTNPRGLGSPVGQHWRAARTGLAIWAAALFAYALLLGTLSKSIATADLGAIQRQLGKLGADMSSASGVLGLYFIFFVLAISLFCCSQLGAARSEEADGRLETFFALPVSRTRWLAGRLALAAAAATGLALAAGLGAAAGANLVGARASFPKLLEAGLNCLPASLLFLGVGALLIAAAPRLGAGAAYALVSLAFLWNLVGDLLGAPGWLVDASPFVHVALVPTQAFRAGEAAVMLAIGLTAALLALILFRRRDLTGV